MIQIQMTKTRHQRVLNFEAFAKSRKKPFSVIPAKAGIQYFRLVTNSLDPGFHRGDDFLLFLRPSTFVIRPDRYARKKTRD
jgi:hypothetical protein